MTKDPNHRKRCQCTDCACSNDPLADPTDIEANALLNTILKANEKDKTPEDMFDYHEDSPDITTYKGICSCGYNTTIKTAYTKDSFSAPCTKCKGIITFTIPAAKQQLTNETVEDISRACTRSKTKYAAILGMLNQAQGTKHDENKPRYDLLPPHALAEVVKVLTHGADKYGEYNWAKGIKFSRLYAATQRHLQAWQSLEDNDPETGINHLAHAMCSLLFLLTFQQQDKKTLDDRHSYF